MGVLDPDAFLDDINRKETMLAGARILYWMTYGDFEYPQYGKADDRQRQAYRALFIMDMVYAAPGRRLSSTMTNTQIFEHAAVAFMEHMLSMTTP